MAQEVQNVHETQNQCKVAKDQDSLVKKTVHWGPDQWAKVLSCVETRKHFCHENYTNKQLCAKNIPRKVLPQCMLLNI